MGQLEERLTDEEIIQKINDLRLAINNAEEWLTIVPVDHRNNIEKQKHDIEWCNKQIATAPNNKVRAGLIENRKMCQSILTSLEVVTPTIQKQQFALEGQLKMLKRELLESLAGKRDIGGAGIV